MNKPIFIHYKWGLFVSIICVLSLYACKQDVPTNSNSITNKTNNTIPTDSTQTDQLSNKSTIESVILDSINNGVPTNIISKDKTVLDSIRNTNLKSIITTTVISKTEKRKPKKKKPKGKLHFKHSNFDFGVIIEGDEIDHSFEFKNIGNKSIDIKKIEVSCGCTTPSYPFTAIAPGETAKIDVSYSSLNKWGKQKAFLTVWTNGSPSKYMLYLEGVVHEREKEDSNINKK